MKAENPLAGICTKVFEQKMKEVACLEYRIFEYDPYLKPFAADIELRMNNYQNKKKELLPDGGKLIDFANGHLYYGFHRVEGGWVYREWAPAAEALYLMGDMNDWNKTSLPMTPVGNGNFELFLPGENALWGGCKVKTVVLHQNRLLERIPLYATRVVQDPVTYNWCAEIVDEPEYPWQDEGFVPQKELFIYECHIGMAQEEEKVGTYVEFRDKVLPRIKELGYNTLQIMAIMEHPYYGSFGYQVSNFFAASSRFGMPADLKSLIDTAHSMGIAVLLDVVHSHAVKNTSEGINEFDGTEYQFFHAGPRGHHPAWDTKLFNYAKGEVIHFLLSNLKFWQTEYHFDGFRFDGVTSMLYHDHGLGTAFTDYSKYFSYNTHVEAITYLQLANELIRQVNPNAITIAEDMSAMPGMCLPIEDGGVGFDYRLSMGVPDMWIKLLKTQSDENWNMRYLWYELSGRRPKEKYIGYAESHDQALVGDKTIMFWLCDSAMYTHMSKLSESSTVIDRGLALHKMIRLLTMSLGGEGYLNFMGNEFGHPEWIDFPREGNNWSSYYCRRQWHLADDHLLRYHYLQDFDKSMLAMAKENTIFAHEPLSLWIDEEGQVLVYERGGVLFIFNFSPARSHDGFFVCAPEEQARYRAFLSTDDEVFGGWERVAKDVTYTARRAIDGRIGFQMYLPARTGICMKRVGKEE